jgi:hypothetical protein
MDEHGPGMPDGGGGFFVDRGRARAHDGRPGGRLWCGLGSPAEPVVAVHRRAGHVSDSG